MVSRLNIVITYAVFMIATTHLPVLVMSQEADKSDGDNSSAAMAFELLFDPAPLIKTRSDVRSKLLPARTSFRELISNSKKNLQIAFVIDGTHSMGEDIQGVTESLEKIVQELVQWKSLEQDPKVSFAIIVYRDAGSPSGGASSLLGNFTDNIGNVKEVLAGIKTEDGQPGFRELMDVGIYGALDKLPWIQDAETSRLMMVFGDAPPWKPGTGLGESRRHFSDQQIVQLATQKEVSISSVLCSSGFVGNADSKLVETFEATAPETKKFLEFLAQQTGGIHLNLSDKATRQALKDRAVNRTKIGHQQIAAIRQKDVDSARLAVKDEPHGEFLANKVRLAVLPHVKSAGEKDYAFATELTERFRSMPGVEVAELSSVIDTVANAPQSEDEQKKWLWDVARELNVDYVIWGDKSETENDLRVRSAMYQGVDGKKIAEAEIAAERELGQLAFVGSITTNLVNNAVEYFERTGSGKPAASILKKGISKPENSKRLMTPVASNARARREMLVGLRLLEEVISVAKDEESFDIDNVQNSIRRLQLAEEFDPKNPIVLSLLTSAYFNLAQTGVADDAWLKMIKTLQRAYAVRDNTPVTSARKEIEADYALLVEKDTAKAIELYESIASSVDETPLRAAVRAHWVLAGIYCGDWGVDPSVVSAGDARKHIIKIFAHWPESPEARFYKDTLFWDEGVGTRNPRVPLSQANPNMIGD